MSKKLHVGCRTVEDKKEEFIFAVETEITRVVNCFETGNEYEGILILKGIQLAFRLGREGIYPPELSRAVGVGLNE